MVGGIGLIFGFSLVGLLKSPEPLKIKGFWAAGGLFRYIFRFSLFRFTGLYMLFSGLAMGLFCVLRFSLISYSSENRPG